VRTGAFFSVPCIISRQCCPIYLKVKNRSSSIFIYPTFVVSELCTLAMRKMKCLLVCGYELTFYAKDVYIVFELQLITILSRIKYRSS
jgi:hypothetical protein